MNMPIDHAARVLISGEYSRRRRYLTSVQAALNGLALTGTFAISSAWFLFLKPFEAPITVQDPAWGEKVLVNRLTVFGLGLLWLFLALRRMDKREKLLA